MRGAGPWLPSLPAAITERTSGLAPALLAALVAIQLTGRNGVVHPDIKLVAVVIAAVLAALRVPLLVCVFSGAVVAAAARALFHLG
jgi:branched-subunit amino acid transport protein